ncbi:MAG: hypothetical protein J0L84_15690, partial [Verrucomicrobia bacterium]|nr:hypothetical protein [Verrucomicrobiota bacterium]
GALVRQDDVIATLGGASVVAADQSGYAEALVALARPDLRLRWRSLAWEGDTVFARPRELNFPSLTHQLQTAGATLVLLQFGEMESFAGAAGVPAFAAAYEQLLTEVGAVVPRRVLLTPRIPAVTGSIEPADREAQIAPYAAAVRELGTRLGLPVVVVPADRRGDWAPGHAVPIAFALSGIKIPPPIVSPDGRFGASDLEALRQAIVARNRVWFDYSRPMNWAFLGGDRTEQPSSRDHRNRSLRWFPAEMEQFRPLITAADQEVWKAAAAVAGGSR